MQIAIGLTHLCDPYFRALDTIISDYAVTIFEASSDCEGQWRINEALFEPLKLDKWMDGYIWKQN